MNSKKIITIVVIVAALAGAGVFGYLSLRDDAVELVTAADGQAATPIILPYGDTLDFETVNKFNQTGRTYTLPVTTAADVGLQLNEIISQ